MRLDGAGGGDLQGGVGIPRKGVELVACIEEDEGSIGAAELGEVKGVAELLVDYYSEQKNGAGV